MSLRAVALIVAAVSTSACATFPPGSSQVVSASDLIDNLKAQLDQVHASRAEAPGGVCSNSHHQVVVVAIPTTATVSLKAVTTLASSGTGGGTFPVLSIPVGPSFTYTNTRAATQIVTFDLNIVHDQKTEADLTNEVKTLRARIESDAATLKDLGHRLAQEESDFLNAQIKTDTATIAADELALVKMHRDPNYSEGSTLNEDLSETPAAGQAEAKAPTLIAREQPLKNDMTIAEAISAAAAELLKVNHNLRPCLKPQTIRVEIDFDVQKKKDGSISITVVAWKFGVERVATSEQFHSILVTFDMTQGSSVR